MSDWVPRPVPKPEPRPKREPKRLRAKKPMRKFNAKRGGSAFPHRRDPIYRRWVWQQNPCLLEGKLTRKRITIGDIPSNAAHLWQHRCWGVMTPAHVGLHQAQGAPDVGAVVPLCEAAHEFYDTRRWEWAEATGLTETKMQHAAEGYVVKYVERGGVLLGVA